MLGRLQHGLSQRLTGVCLPPGAILVETPTHQLGEEERSPAGGCPAGPILLPSPVPRLGILPPPRHAHLQQAHGVHPLGEFAACPRLRHVFAPTHYEDLNTINYLRELRLYLDRVVILCIFLGSRAGMQVICQLTRVV